MQADAPYWTDRRVAVTGATGFVGHHVAARLRAAGANVVALVRASSDRRRLLELGVECACAPLDDRDSLMRAMVGRDVLFHVAGTVDFGDDWDALRRVNVGGTENVLAAARAAGVRRVVFTSSISAVGSSVRPEVLDETATWNLEPYRVAYAATKHEAEQAALAANDGKLEVVTVNPSCVIGPNDHTRSELGTVCRRFWKGRIPFHLGGGNNYVDVRDAAAGHLFAAELGRPGERYILGGENRAAGEFFADLAAAAGRRYVWMRVPRALAIGAAAVAARLPVRRKPRFTPALVKLAGLFFYFTSDKARRELGYAPRPLADTLHDAHAFWCGGGRRAARLEAAA